MKNVTILLSLLICLGCTPSVKKEGSFPDRAVMLKAEYAKYENFFPIATLDLKEKGITDKIHVMYVAIDPDNDDDSFFPGNDYLDEFTFHISKDGLYTPTFKKSVLKISSDFRGYFNEGKSIYDKRNLRKSHGNLVQTLSKPEWWQYDQTPLNSKKQKMTFICQVNISYLFNDDCRLYVFYDKADRVVKYIYQRT
jgi:hypothetical protein